VFGVFLKQKLAGKPFTVVGDGNQTRDFVYVTDVAEAFWLAAETERSGRAYNVGAGNPDRSIGWSSSWADRLSAFPSDPGSRTAPGPIYRRLSGSWVGRRAFRLRRCRPHARQYWIWRERCGRPVDRRATESWFKLTGDA
jgi:UDP-glucose 4-epimerase